jgi:hypothetical protein
MKAFRLKWNCFWYRYESISGTGMKAFLVPVWRHLDWNGIVSGTGMKAFLVPVWRHLDWNRIVSGTGMKAFLVPVWRYLDWNGIVSGTGMKAFLVPVWRHLDWNGIVSSEVLTNSRACSVRTEVLARGVKCLWLVVHHSQPSSADVENKWSYSSSPHLCPIQAVNV